MYTHRLSENFLRNEDRMDGFFDGLKKYPNSCHEIWVASLYGFPKIEAHQKLADDVQDVVKRFRDEGIRVSLQISNTLGHSASCLSYNNEGLFYEGSDVYKVGIDGTVSNYTVCPTSPEFQKYLSEELKVYLLAIQPDGIWIDDDLRQPLAFCCYCDRCMEIFNKQNGLNINREELAEAMNIDTAMRDKWVRFNAWKVTNVMRIISEACLKYSPRTYVALQNGMNGYITGPWQKSMFETVYDITKKEPRYRPGGGAYNDKDPNEFFLKSVSFAHQTRYMPDVVKDIRPEIENLPDVVYGKSLAGQLFETAYYFASASATSMSYATMMRTYEPMSWLNLQLRDMSANYKYFSRLAKVNEETKMGGVELYIPDTPWVRESDSPFGWSEVRMNEGIELMRCAIPTSLYKNNRGAYFLHGAHAEEMTDKEIEELLSKNVFCDGRSIEFLIKRGFGDKLGIKVELKNIRQYLESFLNHPINKDMENEEWSISFFHPENHVIIGEKIEPVTEYRSRIDGSFGGVASAVIETKAGGKWFVAGYTPWTFKGILSFNKRNQYINALEYIGAKVDAILLDRIQAQVFPRINDKGETVAVSVVNTTIGESEELHVLIKNPAGERFIFCQINGEFISIEAEKTPEGTVVTVPSIRPWGVGTIFAE